MLAVDNLVAALAGERPPTLLDEEVWQRRQAAARGLATDPPPTRHDD